MKPKILAWNTGRTYTERGQRIAAIQINDGIFFSDQDRGIEYFMPNCPLEQGVIMHRYDNNIGCEYGTIENRWALIDELNAASENK